MYGRLRNIQENILEHAIAYKTYLEQQFGRKQPCPEQQLKGNVTKCGIAFQTFIVRRKVTKITRMSIVERFLCQ